MDKPASFVYHTPDTSKMACCQYEYLVAIRWPKCSTAGARLGGASLGVAAALLAFVYLLF